MALSELQESWLDRLLALEGSLQRLVEEIHRKSEGVGRQDRQIAVAKLEILAADVEDLILRDTDKPREERDQRITDVRGASDALALMQSKVARQRRDIIREAEDLGIERKSLSNRQVKRELEAEMGEG